MMGDDGKISHDIWQGYQTSWHHNS